MTGTPSAGRPKSVATTIDSATDYERDRTPRQQPLARKEQHDRDKADSKHKKLRLTELAG